MAKSRIMLSHIAEEALIAQRLKDQLTADFLSMIDVFLSSDAESVSAGDRWLDNVSSALAECDIELVLCSQRSVKAPWINFEAGAGWVRDIPVIPVCHQDMTCGTLPIPLSLLQGINWGDPKGLKSLYARVAKVLDCDSPTIDYASRAHEMESWEESRSRNSSSEETPDGAPSDDSPGSLDVLYEGSRAMDTVNEIIDKIGFLNSELGKQTEARVARANELNASHTSDYIKQMYENNESSAGDVLNYANRIHQLIPKLEENVDLVINYWYLLGKIGANAGQGADAGTVDETTTTVASLLKAVTDAIEGTIRLRNSITATGDLTRAQRRAAIVSLSTHNTLLAQLARIRDGLVSYLAMVSSV